MEGNNVPYTPEALSRLPREELRHLLADELNKDTSDIDDVFVRLLLSELNIRGTDPAFCDDETVDTACEKFRMDTENTQKPQKRGYQRWMLAAASIVLVLCILFFALPGTAQADDVQDVLSWWSDSVFRFFKQGKQINVQTYVYETDHPGLQQIYDTVTELGITEPVVPSWIPDGLELAELKPIQTAADHGVFAKLLSKKQHILILMTLRTGEMTLQHEKDESLVNIWDLAGCEHYVVSNENERIVTWVKNGVECILSTDCPEEDVYKIIKSIYTSED